ncbi:unnamed protein product [Rotaria sordida]|uniref:Uncharacterized protein n=1 Tax=Rotaria sordida TaxID=392033 RepID=A0A815R706_9BILA|nr:unnamed protein product [Rotaria sordida]CAF4056075.1 unnamed protein product [Rotaria sordida]CAF4214194.1 unnamed protein product [Rotaria sordida]
MARRAQVENIEKEDAKAELPKLEEEKKVLEKQLDEALKKGENADNDTDAAIQNKIADNLEADLQDLNKEIEETKAKADDKLP